MKHPNSDVVSTAKLRLKGPLVQVKHRTNKYIQTKCKRYFNRLLFGFDIFQDVRKYTRVKTPSITVARMEYLLRLDLKMKDALLRRVTILCTAVVLMVSAFHKETISKDALLLLPLHLLWLLLRPPMLLQDAKALSNNYTHLYYIYNINR